MTDFKSGDVVRLKSGGPAMTIEVIEGHEAVCTWFGIDQGEFRRRHIASVLLSYVAPAATGPVSVSVKR